jgi:hypothetical protein
VAGHPTAAHGHPITYRGVHGVACPQQHGLRSTAGSVVAPLTDSSAVSPQPEERGRLECTAVAFNAMESARGLLLLPLTPMPPPAPPPAPGL